MRDVLCIYYSRTGNTKKVMKAIASEMDAELVELTDGIERSGLRGWLRSGLDAVKKDCPEAAAIETPVWAGRCSSVVRSFLKQHGKELNRVAYVLTRSSEYNVSLKIGSSEDGLNTHINVEISK